MVDVYGKKINCIAVKDFSRLGRNFLETGNLLEKVFPFMNVRFISVNDNYDSENTVFSRSMLEVSFKNLMNEMYSADISKKVKATLKIHKEKGYFSGKPPLGYILKSHKLYIDEKAAEYIRYIFSLAENGTTVTEITKKLNKEKIPTTSEYFGYSKNTLWVRDTVKRVLQNTVYIGTVTRNKNTNIRPRTEVSNDKSEWLVFENSHQPIISKETFEKVQKMLTNKKNGNRGDNYYPELKGKIKCGSCGRTVSRMNKYSVKDGSESGSGSGGMSTSGGLPSIPGGTVIGYLGFPSGSVEGFTTELVLVVKSHGDELPCVLNFKYPGYVFK